MKLWQVILCSAPLLAVGAYLSYRYSPNAPELAAVEKALKGATLVSSSVVNDSSDLNSAIPLPEIQRTYVVHEVRDKVRSALSESLEGSGWHEFWSCGMVNLLKTESGTYVMASPSLLYLGSWDGPASAISLVGGKCSPETPFDATPRSKDPDYTTIYVRCVKNDPISRVLAMVKVK